MAEEKDRTSVPADADAEGAAVEQAGAHNPPAGEDRSPEALAARLEELEQQLEGYRDQALRAQAEMASLSRTSSPIMKP